MPSRASLLWNSCAESCAVRRTPPLRTSMERERELFRTAAREAHQRVGRSRQSRFRCRARSLRGLIDQANACGLGGREAVASKKGALRVGETHLGQTDTEMIAGATPTRTSVKPNFAESIAIEISITAARPTPRPRSGRQPATKGLGERRIRRNSQRARRCGCRCTGML